MSRERDEIQVEDLESAETVYDSLIGGMFYSEQEAAVEWLRKRSSSPEVQAAIRRSIESPLF